MNFEATVQREPLTVLRCDLEYSIRIDAVGDSFLLCEADEFDLHFDFLLFCFVYDILLCTRVQKIPTALLAILFIADLLYFKLYNKSTVYYAVKISLLLASWRTSSPPSDRSKVMCILNPPK